MIEKTHFLIRVEKNEGFFMINEIYKKSLHDVLKYGLNIIELSLENYGKAEALKALTLLFQNPKFDAVSKFKSFIYSFFSGIHLLFKKSLFKIH